MGVRFEFLADVMGQCSSVKAVTAFKIENNLRCREIYQLKIKDFDGTGRTFNLDTLTGEFVESFTVVVPSTSAGPDRTRL